MNAPLSEQRLAEIKDLLRYESSISFHSHRAKESMLLLVAEVEQWWATYGRDALPGALSRLQRAEADNVRLRASAEGAHRRIEEVLDYLATKDATQLSEDAGEMGFHIVAVLDGPAATAAERPEQRAEVERLAAQVAAVRAFAVSHEYRWLHELLDGPGTHGGAL